MRDEAIRLIADDVTTISEVVRSHLHGLSDDDTMAKFKFRAITPEGATVSGIENAVTASMARRALVDRNLAPIDVIEKKSILQVRDHP